MTTNEEIGAAKGVHPDDATLVSWVQGVLPIESAHRLESHIESCDECARRLEAVAAKPDPFLQKLRGAAGLSVTLHGAEGAERSLADANLMFGALALQAGLITAQQLADACVLWSSRGGQSLANLMVEQGWIDETARNSVQALLAAKAAAPRHVGAAETISSRDQSGLDLNVTMPLSSDRLKLLHLHSHGGIGQVWLAQDTILGREVALKELLPELRGSQRHRERFLREARVAAQLSHPGTAPVYEYREEGGRCYYTMRFYSGRTLTEAIQQAHADREKDDKGEAFERLFPLIEQFLTICDTIAYAHSKGIIHRDLKGDNVVLGEFGEVTVIDWGLAKSIGEKEGSVSIHPTTTEPHKTIEGERLGTPGFMSPEQARGEQSLVDERTDVYGLAAVLYEILTGRPPFTGETANEVMHRVETQPPVRPSALHLSTPEDLEAICLKGLSKRKDDRYASASELSEAIRHWVAERLRKRDEFDRQARFYALSHDIFSAMDHAGHIQQVNPAYANYFGYGDDDLPIGEHFSIRLHPDDQALVAKRYRSAQEGQSQGETVLRFAGKDGVYRPARFTLTTIPGDPMIYSVGRPVDEESERRRLVEERSRFFSMSRDMCVIYDENLTIVQLNQAVLDFLGTDEESMIGTQGLGRVHPDDIPSVQPHVEAVQNGASVQDIVCRIITHRGETRLTSWTLSRVAGERTLYAVGRALDEESERRRVQAARARFFTLSPNLFVISDERGRAAEVNPAWKVRLGWEPEEVMGESFHDFVHPDDIAKATRAARRALVREPVVDLEVRMRCKDGSHKRFAWMLTHAPGERVNYGIGREVPQPTGPA